MLVTVGQFAGLTAIGIAGRNDIRTQGLNVGNPCSRRLVMSHNGFISFEAKTLAFPV
jgi:hypothetical protein